jgi:hypothetical protein
MGKTVWLGEPIEREKGKVIGRANCIHSKSELPLNYYKIVVIFEIFLIILKIQNINLLKVWREEIMWYYCLAGKGTMDINAPITKKVMFFNHTHSQVILRYKENGGRIEP